MVKQAHDIVKRRPVWEVLGLVMDPEVPVLSVIDLGIIRSVVEEPGFLQIVITPTYSGCPAMDVIATNIRMELMSAGYADISIRTVLSPSWTTEWMTENGKAKLKAFGIAPPNPMQSVCLTEKPFGESEVVQCPQCNSWNTSLISRFGSTACKSLYRCEACLESFDYFKCH